MENFKKLNKANAPSYLCARQSRVAGFLNFIIVIYDTKWDQDQDPMLYEHKHKKNSKHFPFYVLWTMLL